MKRTNATDRILRDIGSIPADLLPPSPARQALIDLALAGCDVDVYRKWAYGVYQWIVWLRPAHPAMDGRYTLDEWTRDYAQLAAEALARQAVKGDAA